MGMCHHDSVPEARDEETELAGGAVGGAVRVGRTVRRPTGPWTPAVHELMDYLRESGLRGIPEVLGNDEQGRESLSYLEGRGVQVDREVVLDNVLEEGVTWLREYHDLVDGFRPSGPRVWRYGEAALEPGQIICHNDPGAYNWIIQSGHFVAMIDWDMAGPGEPIDDLAFMLWSALPLYREIPMDDVVRRLNRAVDAYGEWGSLTILSAVERRMALASERIAEGQARGDEGLRGLAKVGEPQRTRARVEAFRKRVPTIDSALG